jgi:hypothetical protein
MADDTQSTVVNPWLQDDSKYRRRPKFPYLPSSRQIYDEIYESAVNDRYKQFQSEIGLLDVHKTQIEDRVRAAVLTIVGYDAWRQFHNRSFESFAGMPFWVLILPPPIIALGLPFAVDDDSFLADAASAVGGLAVGVAFFFILDEFQSRLSLFWRDLLASLIVVLVGTLAIAGAFRVGFWGQEALLAGLISSMFVFVGYTFWQFFNVITETLRRNTKERLFPEDEIIDGTLYSLSILPSGENASWDISARRDLSSELLGIADIIEKASSHLAPSNIAPVTGILLHRRFMEIAASIRKLAFDAIFAVDDTSKVLRARLSGQLRAVALGQWGELETAEVPSGSTISTIRRILSGLKSLIVATGPIALVFVVPRVLKAQDPPIVVDDRLIGTVATISVAWLAVYLISWLDPHATQHVETTSNVLGILRRDTDK